MALIINENNESLLNNLARISPNVSNLMIRNISMNSLPDLSSLLNITHLSITNCRSLRTLSLLPPQLQQLSCDGGLTESTILPPSLNSLICSNHNNIRRLPELPENLKYLVCDGNRNLREIPELPQILDVLVLNNNNLTSLTNLPENLSMIIMNDRVDILDERSFDILYNFLEKKRGNPRFAALLNRVEELRQERMKRDIRNHTAAVGVSGLTQENQKRLGINRPYNHKPGFADVNAEIGEFLGKPIDRRGGRKSRKTKKSKKRKSRKGRK